MLEIFDRSIRRIAIAENAHLVSEDERINALWYLNFSLPYDDSKNEYCQPFNYVRWNNGELYRIMPSSIEVGESGAISYQCEHVLATLIDDVLFGYHVVGNHGVYTKDCINYVLDKQLTKNWVLHECDFTRQFEYGWEQETLLSALFSIATPLSDYMWVTDTSVYPWRLSLKRIDTSARPGLYVRYRHNMTSYGRDKDPQQVCTRLYPLGYGEGVNQLTIAKVNNGVPYLQSPPEYVAKYGLISRIWIDRRYEDAESLMAAAQVMLNELQDPIKTYTIGFSELDEADYNKAAIGRRIRILHPELGEQIDTYITELQYDYEDITQSTIVVANKSTDIASSVADMMDRQRIEQAYAQGATQLYAQALQANCDKDNGAVMGFYIPEDMRIINKIAAKVRVTSFRAYSKATSTVDTQTMTSSTTDSKAYSSTDGGGNTYSSSDGGGSTYTTTNSAQQTTTSSSVVLSAENIMPSEAAAYDAAKHNHGIHNGAMLAVYGGKTEDGAVIADGYESFVESGAHSHGAHDHDITIAGHSHRVELYDHSHTVKVPAHSHSTTIPGHSHTVTIPGHAHEITPGIYFFGNPRSFKLYVNGESQPRKVFTETDTEIDLTELLVDSSTSLIPRGSWLTIEIRPDDLAYVSIDMYVQGFVQSRGDKTV